MGGPFTKKISEKIEDGNVPVYLSVIEWVTAAGALTKWAKVKSKSK
jgi:3-hydroxypropionyl-CoA synthetase (ADP-forming)